MNENEQTHGDIDFAALKDFAPSNQSSENEFSEADLEKWRAGANSFKAFWDAIKDRLGSDYGNDVGRLQALFLHERPAAWNDLAVDFPEEVIKCGFKIAGEYVYETAAVQNVIDEHPEVFAADFGTTRADEVMQRLAMAPGDRFDVARGLVLGFPLSAVEVFEESRARGVPMDALVAKLLDLLRDDPVTRTEIELGYFTKKRSGNRAIVNVILAQLHRFAGELGVHPEDFQHITGDLEYETREKALVDVYGMVWSDAAQPQPDSIRLQKRLKTAFEKSGILHTTV